ncbi:hypothetical protein CONPUDRAFT_137561 [Coniophora puteana RWD-64-598 SS2]|uniref:Uncharacterized protein n=1 Tax=Coniophora puteana (strain RWD-64-598) TaxID=741705 RepID=A0A5M3MM65_CONPW|nr:uncharacterized protein CONPUDRAFT_137561 [Coniophora puteana RWD-64-598 SS2]EIW80279.1 hypothetical protein CONPUDRAFT_137561 [Coniophora puteana RWD-64-598 SS2]
MTTDVLLSAFALVIIALLLALVFFLSLLAAVFLAFQFLPTAGGPLINFSRIGQDGRQREFTHAPHHAARQAPKRINSGCAGRTSSLLGSRMMAEMKTILRSVDVSKGGNRAAGGVSGTARPSRDDQTTFSAFLRRRSAEEASTDAAWPTGLGSRNMPGHVAAHQDHEFAWGAAMRIEGGVVEMPTVMLHGRDNCGPTKQVTYASRSLSQASKQNKHGDYLLSPS